MNRDDYTEAELNDILVGKPIFKVWFGYAGVLFVQFRHGDPIAKQAFSDGLIKYDSELELAAEGIWEWKLGKHYITQNSEHSLHLLLATTVNDYIVDHVAIDPKKRLTITFKEDSVFSAEFDQDPNGWYLRVGPTKHD